MRVTEALNPGALRHLVTIQQNTPTADTDGSLVDSWSTYQQVRAAISTTGGREFTAARVVDAKLTHEVKIHYYSAVTPKMRILWGTRVLHITSVVHDEELRRWTVLHCEEIDQ